MQKKMKVLYICLVLILVSLFLTQATLAAPSVPARVVNHAAKECGTMYTGDECETCIPTNGWEILNGDCPQGYTDLGDKWIPDYSCTFSEMPLCCTEGHYGTQGTCPNLVVNPTTKQCTLNNENKVSVASYPIGWIPSPVFLCSENYEWIDGVNFSNNQWNYISVAIILTVIGIEVVTFILLFRKIIKHD